MLQFLYLTMKEPFNLDRMLHRGKYNTDGENKERFEFTWRNTFIKMVGITKEYTTGDKIIAYAFFIYGFIWGVLVCFCWSYYLGIQSLHGLLNGGVLISLLF